MTKFTQNLFSNRNMFTFNHELATLTFKNDLISFKCIPAEVSELQDKAFVSNTNNGVFKFIYDNDKIDFIFSTYGYGGGGAFELTVQMTNDIRKSLKKALREWKVYAVGTPISTILTQIYGGNEIKQMKKQLYNFIVKEITSKLTIGRSDEGIEPFNDTQIQEYLDTNKETINYIVNEMINDYGDDDELEY